MGGIYFCLPCKLIIKNNHNVWGFIANCAFVMTVAEVKREGSCLHKVGVDLKMYLFVFFFVFYYVDFT